MNTQPWFLSSTGNGDLALTFKGLLASVVPLVMVLLMHFHIAISQGDISDFIAAVGGVVSAGMTLYGILRKFDLSFKNRNAVQNPSNPTPQA